MIKFLKGFKYAFCGIIDAIKSERNIRFHIVAAIYVLWFSKFYSFSKVEYSVLFIVIAMVIASEIFNTSIENLVDLASPSYNMKAKKSKDTAAGAVLLTAICAVAVGVLFFGKLDTLFEIYNYFRFSIVRLTMLIISIVLSIFFIFLLFKPKKASFQNNIKE